MSDLVKILPGENKYLSVTWQVNNFCNYNKNEKKQDKT